MNIKGHNMGPCCNFCNTRCFVPTEPGDLIKKDLKATCKDGIMFDLSKIEKRQLKCDMLDGCASKITHIDNKGFIYCADHAFNRKFSVPTRKLLKKEIVQLENGKQIEKF